MKLKRPSSFISFRNSGGISPARSHLRKSPSLSFSQDPTESKIPFKISLSDSFTFGKGKIMSCSISPRQRDRIKLSSFFAATKAPFGINSQDLGYSKGTLLSKKDP